jgi:hypothetical protein
MPAFQIIDSRTGAVVGTAKTISGARRSVDRRDNAFGAVRYAIRDADGRARF